MAGFTIFTLFLFIACVTGNTVDTHKQEVVCYLGSWSVYRPSVGKFMVNDIDPMLCTHVVYSFAGLDLKTLTIKSLDPEYDYTKKAYSDFVDLKKRNPRLKVTLAIGGWTEGSTKYSKMASTSSSRRTFIYSVVNFIKEHRFDGLDLDWEYPSNRGGVPADKQNFVSLVRELREEFDKYDWILTAAFGAGKSTIETAYDIPALSKYLDYIHIMAYDYHGKWDGFTGHNAPLFPRDDESLDQKVLNVEYTVNHYLKEGAPPSKLILGAGLYGRTFLLTNESNFGMSAAANPTAFAGPYTREDGFLGYNEICETQKNESGLWNIVWNRGHQAPYMFYKNRWISYDDDYSLQAKVRFAQEHGLAGMMVWSIDTDDFHGRCGEGKYPLLKSINKALHETAESRPTGFDKDVHINFDIDDDNSIGRIAKSNYNIIKSKSGVVGAPVLSIITLGVTLIICSLIG